MKKVLPWLLLGGLGYFLYTRLSKATQSIDVAIKGISLNLKAANVFSVPVNVTMTISNGSLVSAKFNSFTGDLLYNGNVIGRINYLNPIILNPTSAQDITIPVNISTTAAGRQLIDILLSGVKNINLGVKGNLVSAAGVFPVNSSYQLR